MKRIAWLIGLHLVVTAVRNAVAHVGLGAWPTPAEGAFIGVFIYAGPVIAALLLVEGTHRARGWACSG